MGTHLSQKQVEANRRNALKSTGPRTEQGKQRSRRNGLTHGLAAEVLVPEADHAAYQAELARWEREAGPDNVVEHHLIRRAAIGSVNLDRIESAKQGARESAARQAVRRWERQQQARARRKAQDLPRDPSNTVIDLEATAFGCDWLIRQWQALASPLTLGKGWDQRTLAKAQLLLGLPEGTPGPDADRTVRRLWILAGAAAPHQVATLPRLAAEATLPTEPATSREALRRLVAEQVHRLLALRDESWELIEGPERDAIARLAASADISKEGQLRHRYEVAADRSCSAAIRLYLNLRDRRRRELLAIAKEAGRIDTPRAPVGGGWWREPDSDPAPPGFSRVDARSASPGEPTASPLPPDFAPAAPLLPAPDAGLAPVPEPDGAPARSEPISAADTAKRVGHNPMASNELQNSMPAIVPGAPKRTDPPRAPEQPARSPEAGPASRPNPGEGHPGSLPFRPGPR